MMPLTQLMNCCPPSVNRFIKPDARLMIKSIIFFLFSYSLTVDFLRKIAAVKRPAR